MKILISISAALRNSIANAEMRAKERKAALDKDERAKSKASGATQAQLKKARKLERATEKGKERALEEAGAIEVKTVEESDEVAVEAEKVELKEGKGKRAREERERRRGTIPYNLGEKILLVGEGKLIFPSNQPSKLIRD